jgi:hypothetical protein
MSRVQIAFVLGLCLGFFTTYGVCLAAVAFGYEYIDHEAFKSSRPEDYEAHVRQRTGPFITLFSVGGGLLCAAICSLAASKTGTSKRASPRRSHSEWQNHERPLSRQEFESVVHSCLFVDLRNRSPAFVQGLLVGRLADSAPELAAKIDGFSNEHMAALVEDVRIFAGIVGKG